MNTLNFALVSPPLLSLWILVALGLVEAGLLPCLFTFPFGKGMQWGVWGRTWSWEREATSAQQNWEVQHECSSLPPSRVKHVWGSHCDRAGQAASWEAHISHWRAGLSSNYSDSIQAPHECTWNAANDSTSAWAPATLWRTWIKSLAPHFGLVPFSSYYSHLGCEPADSK